MRPPFGWGYLAGMRRALGLKTCLPFAAMSLAVLALTSCAHQEPTWTTSKEWTALPAGTGSISGTIVQEEGGQTVPSVGAKLTLDVHSQREGSVYWQSDCSRKKLASTISDHGGRYTFRNIPTLPDG